MTQYRNDCKECDIREDCIGHSCPMMHAPHWYCDDCRKETDPRKLYKLDGAELCKKCVIRSLKTVM